LAALDDTGRARYSSFDLDEFHRLLLNSDNEEELMHGLLSVVFWGFASGSSGQITKERALFRSRALVYGRSNAKPQPSEPIISHLIKSRGFLSSPHSLPRVHDLDKLLRFTSERPVTRQKRSGAASFRGPECTIGLK
jgi:hypothetical protein